MGWSNGLKKQMTDLSHDRGQDELMRALNFAPRSEFKKLGKQLAGLKRRVRELDEKVTKLTGPRASSSDN